MIYDITQPLFECEVYPGDKRPKKIDTLKMSNGSPYNLTSLYMCAHNGTHVDAPRHFYEKGKGIDAISLDKFIGPAYIQSHSGNISKVDAENIKNSAKNIMPGSENRILIKGDATVTEEAAEFFADSGIYLLGNESQTVGPIDNPMPVHLILLKAEVVLLEGIRLSAVTDGVYFLNCAPLNLTDCDGSPCRAILMDIKGN